MSSVLDLKRINAEPSTVRGAAEVLTEAALDFLAELHERFDHRRRDLLEARAERQQRFDAGELPDFPAETRDIRETEWTRLTFRDRRGATTRYVITQEAARG